MYDNYLAPAIAARRAARILGAFAALVAWFAGAVPSAWAQLPEYQPSTLIRHVSSLGEKLELTTNTSRIITADEPILRFGVNNPDLLSVTALSATEVQISAKKAGVTQVNLWDNQGNVHTVDVLIYGDVRELEIALQVQFPHSSIRVFRYSENLVLKGYIDQPEHVSPIMRMAEDYAPKVINNMTVGGAQQVLLNVKIYEVSRSKLRRLGVDWSYRGGSGAFAVNSISEILSIDADSFPSGLLTNNADTFAFGIVNGNDRFFGLLETLQENKVAKILAEPRIVAISGRAAKFSSGGETPILIPQSLGTTTIEFKEFGTIVDFVPIVLGNGNIRLEVRPEVSTLDRSLGIELDGISVPGFRQRRVNTSVEMKAGQTFALAGLVEERVDASSRGLPYLADLPIIGFPFRKVQDQTDEVELVILVTPEFVDPIDPHEVPCSAPGLATTSPTNHDFYCGGHVEVPAHCNPIRGPLACGDQCYGPAGCQCGGQQLPGGMMIQGGVGYDNAGHAPTPVPGVMMSPQGASAPTARPAQMGVPRSTLPANTPEELSLPSDSVENGAMRPAGAYSPPRSPVYMRTAPSPNNPQGAIRPSAVPSAESGLIGPIGYDMD
jgi:pilus assembly protein CpaC